MERASRLFRRQDQFENQPAAVENHDVNRGEINDLENDGGRLESHAGMLPGSRDRNAGQRLHSQVRDTLQVQEASDVPAESKGIQWQPYNMQEPGTFVGELWKDKYLALGLGFIFTGLGTGCGALMEAGSHDKRLIGRDAGIGAGIGAALTGASLLCTTGDRLEKQRAKYENAMNRIGTCGYSKLALGGNRGILNAKALDVPVDIDGISQFRLIDELPRILDRALTRTEANDKRVAELIRIVHEDSTSAATKSLVEALKILVLVAKRNNVFTEQNCIDRIDGAITRWKHKKPEDFTALVLYRGLRKAGIPAQEIDFTHAELEKGNDEVSTYLKMKNSDFPKLPMVLDKGKHKHAREFLQKDASWKEHLEKFVPTYGDELEVVKHFEEHAYEQLEERRTQMISNSYLTGMAYIQHAKKGELLARWYAEECLKNPEFMSTVDKSVKHALLVEKFNCAGVSETGFQAQIRQLYPKQNLNALREANLLTSPSEVEGIELRQQSNVNMTTMPLHNVEDLEASVAVTNVQFDMQDDIQSEQKISTPRSS